MDTAGGAERVSLLVTCLVDAVEPDVGTAAVRLLRAAGCTVSFPSDQTCCGQPAWNAGFAESAGAVARTTLRALERDGADAVVVPAGSCATMVRVFWPELFEVLGDGDAAERARELGARTHELTEFLAARGLPAAAADGDGGEARRVAYHHSCHMLRELRIKDAPEALLGAVPGCERVEWDGDERCCGFGGLFSVKQPETSVAMADDKLASLDRTGADLLVGADTSCLLHLRGRAERSGRTVEVRHIAEVLAAALPRSDAEPPDPEPSDPEPPDGPPAARA
jgi:L-lactate dehydrogenase complex protein LldE